MALVVAASSSAQASTVVPVAIGPAVAGGQAAYSITAKDADICVAVYLLNDAGFLHFVRYRLVQAFYRIAM
jgi:hypothetical protein